MEVTCVFSFMFFDLFILVVLICDKDKKNKKTMIRNMETKMIKTILIKELQRQMG